MPAVLRCDFLQCRWESLWTVRFETYANQNESRGVRIWTERSSGHGEVFSCRRIVWMPRRCCCTFLSSIAEMILTSLHSLQHLVYREPTISSYTQTYRDRDFFVELWDVSGHQQYKDCRSIFYSQINGNALHLLSVHNSAYVFAFAAMRKI